MILLFYIHFCLFWPCSYVLAILLLGSITNPSFDVHVSFLIKKNIKKIEKERKRRKRKKRGKKREKIDSKKNSLFI